MSPEIVTEMSVVYWTGDHTQRALEQHPIVHRQDMAAVLADKLLERQAEFHASTQDEA